MRKDIQPGALLKKARRQDKGKVFTVTDVVDTEKGNIYILKCYRIGKTKALRHSSLSDYKLVNK